MMPNIGRHLLEAPLTFHSDQTSHKNNSSWNKILMEIHLWNISKKMYIACWLSSIGLVSSHYHNQTWQLTILYYPSSIWCGRMLPYWFLLFVVYQTPPLFSFIDSNKPRWQTLLSALKVAYRYFAAVDISVDFILKMSHTKKSLPLYETRCVTLGYMSWWPYF